MTDFFVPAKIVSGGQTGVDRAALDWAIAAGIEHGGWCPRGRRAEDGPLDPRYQLVELSSFSYADRTRKNVEDADATLILYGRRLEGGTLLTARHAAVSGKPSCKVRLYGPRPVRRTRQWIAQVQPLVLNIAGPRGSTNPRIYELTLQFLNELFGVGESRLF